MPVPAVIAELTLIPMMALVRVPELLELIYSDAGVPPAPAVPP